MHVYKKYFAVTGLCEHLEKVVSIYFCNPFFLYLTEMITYMVIGHNEMYRYILKCMEYIIKQCFVFS